MYESDTSALSVSLLCVRLATCLDASSGPVLVKKTNVNLKLRLKFTAKNVENLNLTWGTNGGCMASWLDE